MIRFVMAMTFVFFSLFAFHPANASLINNGNNLVYDTDLDITWYVPSVENMTWGQAMAWAANLVVGTASDWRLPTAGTTPTSGYYNIFNELGHLYYVELENDMDSSNTVALKTGPFAYLQSANYWTNTTWSSYSESAWVFSFRTGSFGHADKNPGPDYINFYYALAVHSGNVTTSQTPLPSAILLFVPGLAGLALVRKRFCEQIA